MDESELARILPVHRSKLANHVQAHLGRAAWFADGKTRTWSLFLFFRILAEVEIQKDWTRLARLVKALREDDNAATKEAALELVGSFEDPALLNAGLVAQSVVSPG